MGTEVYNRIESLVERFFDGETTAAEERELYTFFAGNDVPESLEQYRRLFQYIENDMPAELTAVEETFVPARRFSIGSVWIGIAAAIAIIVGVTFYPFHNEGDNKFAGSYIIRNGVRITDPKVVLPEVEATVQMIAEQRNEVSTMKENVCEVYKDVWSYLPDRESMSNMIREKVYDTYDEILSHFPDEESQAIVRRILYKE